MPLRLGFVLLILLALLLGVMKVSGRCSNEYSERTGDAIDALRPEMDVELLTVNPYSRPGTSTQKITGSSCITQPIPGQLPWRTGIILRILRIPMRQKPAVILWWGSKVRLYSAFRPGEVALCVQQPEY